MTELRDNTGNKGYPLESGPVAQIIHPAG